MMLEDYISRDASLQKDPVLVEKLIPVPSKPSGERINEDHSESGSTAEEIFHESAGWRHLETTLKAVQMSINASNCLEKIATQDTAFIELVYRTLVHSNRFVRETGYQIVAELAQFLNEERFVIQIARGLSDNWSQVRMAASQAARYKCVSKI